ncbi:permease for cytosine/purines, uracil, thiamine, allantoin-domain-containing protein [Pestalotiopsis sp. NC0098]|nr:permease for cytosine/purines, uracil, thiamine, allantoin-domain-containing protein [Pestalotiopsis sp. NC0098]
MPLLRNFTNLSWQDVLNKLEAPQNPYSTTAAAEHDKSKPIWSNSDLDPTPPASRTWTWLHYTSFWLASSFATGTWTTGSAMIALGMPWYAAWLAVVVSHAIGAALLVANGRGPAAYHIGFPVYARASFGMWGSYFAIVSRCVVAAIWYAVNAYYGSNFVSICMRCIWPSWNDVPNHLPSNAGTTTQLLGALAIFWVLSMPFVFIHPKNLNWYFVAKSCMVGPACFAVLIWAVVLNGGSVGPSSFQTSPRLADPSYYGWLWMSALNSGFGGCSALIVAQADIARWARRPADQTWSQLVTYPVFSALPALFGILVASATSSFWGREYWNLWDVLSAALDYYAMSPASRGLVFLASFAFAVAILGTNVAANSLPFGSDIAGLLPRWISIRRGQVLCSLLVFPIVPWKIISSAKSLLTFLSGYSILMGPFASICIVDYFFVRNGNLKIPDLYVGGPESQYWYSRGWNLRMVAAWILGVALPFPGFVASFGTTASVGAGANPMWNMGYLLSIFVSGAVYYVLFLVFPDPSIDKSLSFEQLASLYDGVIEGEEAPGPGSVTADEVSRAEKGSVKAEASGL